jgi:hypothetical protein
VLLVLLSAVPARAETCAERVEQERQLMSQEAAKLRTWIHAWQGGLLMVTAGQVAALPLVSKDDRIDLYIGSASSLFGLVALTLTAPALISEAPKFEARAADPAVDRCVLAEDGQRILKQGAAEEAFGTGVTAHAGNAVFNLALGALLGFGFGHWESALCNVLAGTAIGEALILTQPTGLTF